MQNLVENLNGTICIWHLLAQQKLLFSIQNRVQEGVKCKCAFLSNQISPKGPSTNYVHPKICRKVLTSVFMTSFMDGPEFFCIQNSQKTLKLSWPWKSDSWSQNHERSWIFLRIFESNFSSFLIKSSRYLTKFQNFAQTFSFFDKNNKIFNVKKFFNEKKFLAKKILLTISRNFLQFLAEIQVYWIKFKDFLEKSKNLIKIVQIFVFICQYFY